MFFKQNCYIYFLIISWYSQNYHIFKLHTFVGQYLFCVPYFFIYNISLQAVLAFTFFIYDIFLQAVYT